MCNWIRTSKNSDAVDNKGLMIDTVNFNDGHSMAVNGKDKVRVARYGNQTETVAGSPELVQVVPG